MQSESKGGAGGREDGLVDQARSSDSLSRAVGTGWGDGGGIQRHFQNRALGATPPSPHPQPDAMNKEKNEASIPCQDSSLGAGPPVKALPAFGGRAFANKDHAGSTGGTSPWGEGSNALGFCKVREGS